MATMRLRQRGWLRPALLYALAAYGVALWSCAVVGMFLTSHTFPKYAGYVVYPLPWRFAGRHLAIDALVAAVGIALSWLTLSLPVSRVYTALLGSATLRSTQLLVLSAVGWGVMFAWEPAGRNAWGSGGAYQGAWEIGVLVAGLVILLAGTALVGHLELFGLRQARGRHGVPRRRPGGQAHVAGVGLMLLAVLMMAWVKPQMPLDRLLLSTVVSVAGVLLAARALHQAG